MPESEEWQRVVASGKRAEGRAGREREMRGRSRAHARAHGPRPRPPFCLEPPDPPTTLPPLSPLSSLPPPVATGATLSVGAVAASAAASAPEIKALAAKIASGILSSAATGARQMVVA